MKSRYSRLFVRICLIVGICILAGFFIWLGMRGARRFFGQPNNLRAVSVQGVVVPAEAVDLSFGASGTIGMVNNLIGDTVVPGAIIASLDNASARADLAEAQADLRLENKKLKSLRITASSTVELNEAARRAVQAQQALFATLQSARLSAEDAIYNKTDEFFLDPNSTAPRLLFSATSTSQISIESGRVEVGSRLLSLDTMLANASTSDDLESLSLSTKEDIAEVNLFLDTTALSLNALGTSSPNSTPIIVWKSDLAAARAEVSGAISSIFAADKDLADADATLADAENPGMSESILLEESKVAQAQAAVAHAQATLRERSIVSPIAGVVSKQNAKLGEQAAAGIPLVSVISSGTFQIQSAVSESLVPDLFVGKAEQVTLDAYGSKIPFSATVISIDPDGAATSSAAYNAIFQFDSEDARIKSGMAVHISLSSL